MRGDRTITAGEDAKQIRARKMQAMIDEVKNRPKPELAGYCGCCSTHYKGNYTKHTCKK